MRNLIEVKNLKKYFKLSRGLLVKSEMVHAVDGVDFYIREGETFGLVGESGCGKTTVAYLTLGLLKPTEGEVFYDTTNIFTLRAKEMKRLRREMQIIFQDPLGSLDSRMTVGKIVEEPLTIHGVGDFYEKGKKVAEIVEKVGLKPEDLDKHPHEFSGGQRQRISIARALILHPRYIVCDEPVSSLDVSVRSVILNLMKDIQDKFNLTYLFITHDLSVIRHMCDRIAMMYLGKIMEVASKKELFASPEHPYTRALMSAIPIPNPKRKRQRIILKGEVPSPINIPPGCRFHTRCQLKMPVCKREDPGLVEIRKGHMVACHLYA